MENEKWGFGNPSDKKPFDEVMVGNEKWALLFGEHPHSRSDNNIYAKSNRGSIHGFSGHRRPFRIEIKEYNYLKTSHFSGDEVRNGGLVKVFLNGEQIYERFCRSYQRGYKLADQFIDSLELLFWYPRDTKSMIGSEIGYREQLAVIDRFITTQGCMIIKRVDGKPFDRFLWEDKDEYEPQLELKVEINDPAITWFPKP